MRNKRENRYNICLYETGAEKRPESFRRVTAGMTGNDRTARQ